MAIIATLAHLLQNSHRYVQNFWIICIPKVFIQQQLLQLFILAYKLLIILCFIYILIWLFIHLFIYLLIEIQKSFVYFLVTFLHLLQINFPLGITAKPAQNWWIHILQAPSHFTHGTGIIRSAWLIVHLSPRSQLSAWGIVFVNNRISFLVPPQI